MVVTGWRQIASYENREGEGEKGGWERGKDNFPFAFLFALPAFHYPLFPLSLFGGRCGYLAAKLSFSSLLGAFTLTHYLYDNPPWQVLVEAPAFYAPPAPAAA